MPLIPSLRRVLAQAILLLCLSSVVLCQPPKTLVEVWSGGDDGLTQKLRDSLEKTFQSSPEFQLSAGKRPGSLVVTIPSNVAWRQVKGRTRVVYAVEFASVDGFKLGSGKGECLEDDLVKCASRIVADARLVTRKLRK